MINHRQRPNLLAATSFFVVSVWLALARLEAQASAFTPGNLAVEFCANTSSSSTFSIVELSPGTANQTTPVNTIAIPSTGATALRQSASAATTGLLADSSDGTLLAFTGFADPTGVTDETTITTRAVGTLDVNDNFLLQCAYTGVSGNQTRSATSRDNQTWYISDKGGVYTNGVSAPLNATNILGVKSFGGAVYVLSQKFGAVISTLAANATRLTPLPGLPADGKTTDFFLISSGNNGTFDILYYLDESSATLGTLYKYSLVGGTWTANGSYGTSFGGDGLCAATNGSGGAWLYATTGAGGTSGNKVVQLTDTAGFNANILITGNSITLYTAPSGTTLKGIAFAPVTPSNPSLLTPPTLAAAAGATVDGPFNITFTDTTGWHLVITNLSVGDVTLAAGYTVYSDHITFTPSACVPANLLQTAGLLNLVIGATGYNPATVSQPLGVGAAANLALTAQAAAPSASGGTLITQPVVTVQDQFGNTVTTSTAVILASVGSGAWTLGGATNQTAVGGVAGFTNLSATVNGLAEVDGATISFTAPGLNPVTSTGLKILAPPTAFTPGNLAVLQADSAATQNSTLTILELSPASQNTSPVNTVPISATGAQALRNSGSAGSTGRLADSDDGTLLAFAAFASGSSAVTDETTITNRVAGTLDAKDHLTWQCAYVGISGNQARGATSRDNLTWFISDKGGIYTNGLVAPANTNNVRSIRSFGGTVYVLSQDTTVISTVSPTGAGLTGLTDGAGANLPTDGNAVDFYLISSRNNGTYDILYYLDATNATAGAIYKYSLQASGNGWLPNGSWPTANGGDGFCAATNGTGGASLYYTTGSGGTANNSVVGLTDSAGWNASINLTATNTLYTAGLAATLKGIAFAPVPAPAAPAVTMLAASNITAGSAILFAWVNPQGAPTTNAFFCNTNPGASATYYNVGTILLPAGQVPVSISNLVAGLLPGKNYNYYVDAGNSVGLYDGSGAMGSFTTLAIAPPLLAGVQFNGSNFGFAFTNTTGASFSVLATNDLTAPRATWPVVGQAIESPAGSGNFQFADPVATNPVTFYLLRQP